MSGGKKKLVTPIWGNPFEVDISNEACGKFEFVHNDITQHFVHGQVFKHPQHGTGVVEGVASSVGGPDPGPNVLWIIFEEDVKKCGKLVVSFCAEIKEVSK
ncbi:MAG: hypothetical protein Q7T51_04785 [Candidatus Moranbacteria bacterium]|nr:hypothetical protein [Candidatus Moranbacteria bacterium]